MKPQTLSRDVELLAGQWKLGTPLCAYRRVDALRTILVGISIGLVMIVFAGVMLYATLHPSFASTAPFARAPGSDAYIGCSIALLIGCVALASGIKAFKYLGFRAWECSEGFLEYDNTGSLRAALRWDQIQIVWHRVKVSNSSRSDTRYHHTYSVLSFDGREVTLSYPHLWKRIEQEFVRLHLPQALATLNAGQTLSFHGIVLSQQGIANQPVAIRSSGMVVPNSDQPWHIPWQTISNIRVKRATIELEGPGLTCKTGTLLMLASVSNVCLLKAVVRTLQSGRVNWIEQK
jgi:hypothetical protein